MVEVEFDPALADGLHCARATAGACGAREADDIARRISGVGVAVPVEPCARDAPHERRIAHAERAAGRQIEGRMRAFGKAEQTRFDRRRELALAERERRRRAGIGADELDAVGPGEPVMQRQERIGADERGRGHEGRGHRAAAPRRARNDAGRVR
jgi:hypothetical protein